MNILAQQRLVTKLLPAILGLSFLIPLTTAEARITFNAPSGLGVPGRRVAGGARVDNNCLPENKPLTAIVPQSNVGLTTLENPILFFYIPRTSAPELELVVQTQDKRSVKQIYKPTGKAGVVGFSLKAATLEVGKEYHWFFAVICNPKQRSEDQVVDGAIKRIQTQPQLITKLKGATPQERGNVYAESGIWYDSLATLAQLLSSRPNDVQLKADWKALLTAQHLDKQANEPLLEERERPQPIY